jgi:protein-S-isoprenylcysteine O-methyltransferase Ste14
LAERLFNWGLGLSVLSWAALGLIQADAADRLTAVRLTVSGLNLIVGILFITRSRVVHHGSLAMIALCVPGVAVAGFALRLAPVPHQWPVPAAVLFVVGGAWTAVSFLFLGRSFAILPALRRIVSHGPYRFVRHPGYLGELLMVLACLLARPSLLAAAPLAAAVPLVVIRVLAEERTLGSAAEYAVYRDRVKYRLLPGVW